MTALCSLLLVTSLAAAPAALADETVLEEAIPADKIPETTRYSLEVAHPISIHDAISAAEEAGLQPVAYRFENVNLVGEFSPTGGQTVDEFLEGLNADYGVSPAIAEVILEAPTEEVQNAKAARAHLELGSQFPEVKPEPISDTSIIGSKLAQQIAAEPEASTGAVMASTRWDPDIAQNEVKVNNSATIKITGHYVWADLSTSPLMLPLNHGLEFEVNTYSPSLWGPGRPVCNVPHPAYKYQPFVVNEGWSWSGYVGLPLTHGTTYNVAALGVYADYNDLSDECSRNSMAIGVAIPQDIPLPYQSSQYYFGWQIIAPKGLDSSGRMGANIQTVTSHACQAAPTVPLTDCMGVYNSGWSDNRMVLNESRNIVGPGKCWVSQNFGTTTPSIWDC